jgi:molybdate-binding protein
MAVVRGEAEFALASRAWAVRAGLGFLPIVSEGYALALRTSSLGQAGVAALGEFAQSARYRKLLNEDLGYDVRRAGELRFGSSSAGV